MYQDSTSLLRGSRFNHRNGSHELEHMLADPRDRSSPFSRRSHSSRSGLGREGRHRLNETPSLELRGPMNGLRTTSRQSRLGRFGGGLGGGNRVLDGGFGPGRMPAMADMMTYYPGEGDMFGRGLRGPPMMPPSADFMNGPMMGRRRPSRFDSFENVGMGAMEGMMSPLSSGDSLPRRGSGMMPMQMPMPLGLGIGRGSRTGSIHSGDGLGARGMEVARMGMGRGLSNYQHPYVEDYESMVDPEEYERHIQQMEYMEMMGGGPFDYPDDFGDGMLGEGFGGFGGRPY